jgi:hypothetical protein
MEDKIVELLGAGVSQKVVADSVGVDPSYVSQLMAREDVAARVAELRAVRATQFVEHDSNIESLEKQALERMAKLLPLQSDIMKITRVFQVLNGARKSMEHGVGAQAAAPGAIVSITLPEAAQVHFRLTADKQVVEIEGRSMVPMPSHMVAAQLRAKKSLELLEHSAIAPRAPTVSAKARTLIDSL